MYNILLSLFFHAQHFRYDFSGIDFEVDYGKFYDLFSRTVGTIPLLLSFLLLGGLAWLGSVGVLWLELELVAVGSWKGRFAKHT